MLSRSVHMEYVHIQMEIDIKIALQYEYASRFTWYGGTQVVHRSTLQYEYANRSAMRVVWREYRVPVQV